MFEKLKSIRLRYDDISNQISQPEVIGNQKLYIKLSKEYKEIEPLVLACNQYELLIQDIEESRDLMANETEDSEIIEMAQLQLDESEKKLEQLEGRVKLLLIPKDPEDEKNVVVEIRAGAGGDEAGIFAGDLYRMYTKYCELRRWKVELVDFSESTSGGFKEVIFNVFGQNVYGDFKFEGGVHRVQRVPQTETQGRVHTSAASVVVMPEADDFDVELDMKDVRKDLFCSSGPGGQSVNTTYSAVRLTHVPTGIVAQCQDEKSQHKNFEKAFKVLRTRLYEVELSKQLLENSEKRKSMVSTGDRSAKIRTYNYPQSRVTEHRIGLTLYDLDNIINGGIQKIIDELKLAENIEKMKVVS